MSIRHFDLGEMRGMSILKRLVSISCLSVNWPNLKPNVFKFFLLLYL